MGHFMPKFLPFCYTLSKSMIFLKFCTMIGYHKQREVRIANIFRNFFPSWAQNNLFLGICSKDFFLIPMTILTMLNIQQSFSWPLNNTFLSCIGPKTLYSLFSESTLRILSEILYDWHLKETKVIIFNIF